MSVTRREAAGEAQLREAMITELRWLDAVRTRTVEDAFRMVRRPIFMPEFTVAEAYGAESVAVTKRGADGTAISSVSSPRIQAFMLEQAKIEPGMRVLEVGSGGCNASLLAELVGTDGGSGGAVTSIDIDPDVTRRAAIMLADAGYPHVHVVTGDGTCGVSDRAPFDRIMVTAEAIDIAPAWITQLVPGGRIVVPLRLRGLTRSVAFASTGDGSLVSDDYQLCGFVPMRGPRSCRTRTIVLHDETSAQTRAQTSARTGADPDARADAEADDGPRVALTIDCVPCLDPARMRHIWRHERVEAWSGVTTRPMTPFDDLELWLATTMPGFAVLSANRAARESGLVGPHAGTATALDVGTGSFAYLVHRQVGDKGTLFEFGAVAHGPAARRIAEDVVEQIRAWDAQAHGTHARFAAAPMPNDPATWTTAAGTPIPPGPGNVAARVIDRPFHRFTITWPAP